MKRRELLRYLEINGCELLREGSNHSVCVNRRTQKSSAVPRHNEISIFLARKVCRDLEVPMPVGAREEITSYDAG